MTEPYRILLAALRPVASGAYFTSDDWHDQAHHASLTSAEKAAAQQDAIDEGYLVRVIVPIGNRTAAVQVPSQVPSRKGGGVQLHVRTSKALPGQPAPMEHHRDAAQVDGQIELFEVAS